jgi:hypothetical protein
MVRSGQLKQNPFYRNAHRYFLLALLVIVIGFFPSYFSRLSATDTAHHLHGITATLWMLMLIVQPWFFNRGYMKWHRTLGKFTFVLVPILFVSGLHMIYLMLTNASNYPPLIPYQLAFIDFTVLPIFMLFYSLAIFHRKNIQFHARYMVCTIFGPLIPALTRMLFIVPAIDNFTKSLNISYLIMELVIVILLWDDKRSGKIRPPYVLALIVFLTDHLFMNFASQWHWWRSWMDSFANSNI